MSLRYGPFPHYANHPAHFALQNERNCEEKRDRYEQKIVIFPLLLEVRMDSSTSAKVVAALETFRIEIPSWGFANTGTRFGKFIQPAAATTIDEKFSDAGLVHSLTGVCPTVALHVLWDFPQGIESTAEIEALAHKHGIRPGSINPNLFQDQIYKFGSLCHPDPAVRDHALAHSKDSVEIAKRLHCRDISFWMADGSN